MKTKISLVMVSTLNGKITKGDNPNVGSWASSEDQKFFTDFKKNFKVSIMGSGTYEAAINDIDLSVERLRIVVTRDPKKYEGKTVPGKIEFTPKSPKEIVKELNGRGFDDILLLGGGEINRLFLEEDLVTDFYLTLEPKFFGKGRQVVVDGDYFLDFKLVDAKKLNHQGTYLFHYTR